MAVIFENKKEKKVIDPANQLASTPIDLVQLGLNEVAYIRPTIIDETMVWSIYNAAGDHMGAAQTREQAVGAILRHHMAPHYVN